MKKQLILALTTLICISLCACGGSNTTNGDNKDDGSIPNQTTQNDTQSDNKPTENDTTICAEDLVNYYDVNKYPGTPRFVEKGVKILKVDTNNNKMTYRDCETEKEYETEYIGKVWDMQKCDCIKVDNNTADDTSDDTIVYIFSEYVEYTE